MTQIVKKEAVNDSPFPFRLRKLYQDNRECILNCLFREISLASNNGKVRTLNSQEYIKLASRTHLSVSRIKPIVREFLVWLVYFRKFLRTYQFSYAYTKDLRKLRTYIHKLHRIVPVFDLDRALENARILKLKLDKMNLLPQFLTQLAIVIYVTDVNDIRCEKRIKQINLRILCNCSAYAFHRTRNRLNLK